MNRKKEIIRRAQEIVAAFNSCTNRKCQLGGFHTRTDGTEYLLLKSNYETIFYGFIERFTEATTLKFFGVSNCNGKLYLFFFRGEGMKINE